MFPFRRMLELHYEKERSLRSIAAITRHSRQKSNGRDTTCLKTRTEGSIRRGNDRSMDRRFSLSREKIGNIRETYD